MEKEYNPPITYSLEDFFAEINTVKNHIDKNASFEGCMYETFGEEKQHVYSTWLTTPRKVWTLVQGDTEDEDGCDLIVMSGYHWVNRIGYFIEE